MREEAFIVVLDRAVEKETAICSIKPKKQVKNTRRDKT